LFYYNHAAKKEGLAGVSAMPLKVVESRKEYDWSVNKPVEFRPYVKEIAGKKRLFVLSTVAAKRDDSKKFDGAATPDLALIDCEYRDVVWIDAKHPSQWENTILNQLGETWKAEEGLKDEDIWPNREEIDIIPTIENDSIRIDSMTERVVEVLGDSIN